MPCNSDGYPDTTHIELNACKANLREATAVACALANQIMREDLNHLIDRAEENGKVNIKDWLREHKCQDESKLKKLLENLSKDEIDLLKTILNS